MVSGSLRVSKGGTGGWEAVNRKRGTLGGILLG